jgi:hypothetical protein
LINKILAIFIFPILLSFASFEVDFQNLPRKRTQPNARSPPTPAGQPRARPRSLVTMDAAGLRVTPAGAPLLRVVAMRFDATLPAAPARRHAMVI